MYDDWLKKIDLYDDWLKKINLYDDWLKPSRVPLNENRMGQNHDLSYISMFILISVYKNTPNSTKTNPKTS